ncbi:MAG: hypothetical protein JWN60_1803 [Acidobacteria bacterium]|nr:hypothetical protein [Acidobacteriota bacterium]
MIFCDYYLPGYKSGGGMWTIVNLVDRFCHQYDFFVVTRNYDGKGDRNPYTTVKTDEWNRTGNANVYYFSPKNLSRQVFADLINEIKPHAFFLNSIFATPVIKFLSARRNKAFADIPVILAPCGEASAPGLAIKPFKKMIFLRYAKSVNLYRNIIWKASSESEKNEIKKVFGDDTDVLIAPDLTPKTILPGYAPELKPFKKSGSAKFVFLSRIARKKNLHFFLERLSDIKSEKIELMIIGPREDADYLRKCRTAAEKLPENITVTFAGAFPYTKALEKVCESHFFVLPTLTENFGYVCIEALAAGCPLLLSDRTIWNDIENHNAGWETSLDDYSMWNKRIKECVKMDDSEYRSMSSSARRYAVEWLAKPEHAAATAKILEKATVYTAKNVTC